MERRINGQLKKLKSLEGPSTYTKRQILRYEEILAQQENEILKLEEIAKKKKQKEMTVAKQMRTIQRLTEQVQALNEEIYRVHEINQLFKDAEWGQDRINKEMRKLKKLEQSNRGGMLKLLKKNNKSMFKGSLDLELGDIKKESTTDKKEGKSQTTVSSDSFAESFLDNTKTVEERLERNQKIIDEKKSQILELQEEYQKSNDARTRQKSEILRLRQILVKQREGIEQLQQSKSCVIS